MLKFCKRILRGMKTKKNLEKNEYFHFKINLPDKRCDPDFCLIILIKLRNYI